MLKIRYLYHVSSSTLAARPPLTYTVDLLDQAIKAHNPLRPSYDDVTIMSFDKEGSATKSGTSECGFLGTNVNDVICVPPGLYARNWYPFIHAVHYRNTIYEKFRQCKYCVGNRDSFLWGNSIDIPFEAQNRERDLLTPSEH